MSLPNEEERVEDKSGLSYVPSPTLARFHADDSFYRGVMGPFRSGKSTAMVQEILMRSAAQKPFFDREIGQAVRRTRWAIIRKTYPELLSTTIRTWTSWVPESRCRLKRGGAPITGRLFAPMSVNGKPDGTYIEMEVDFIALEREQDKAKLLGTEYTGAWVNEAREIDEGIIDFLGRVGSYPYAHHGGATWSGIIMDTNPPHTRNWWYRKFEQERPSNWACYKQPGALRLVGDHWIPNPAAENVQNIQQGYMYWLRQVPGKDADWVRVYCGGEYGSIFDGKPVYELYYRDSEHASTYPLGWFRGVPLVAGIDFGLMPALILGQLTPMGTLHILREYIGAYMGIEQLLSEVVKPALARDFPGATIGMVVGDPAGRARAQADITMPDCFEICRRNGIPAVPAQSNDIVMRRQAVIDFLSRRIGGRPALLIDPSCQMLREGFLGGYSFARVQTVTADSRYRDVPEKNDYSHPHDALQYLCMGVAHPTLQRARRRAPEPISTGWCGYR